MGIGVKEPEVAVSAGRRLALLICNGTFTNMPNYNLFGPAKDAKLLASVLTDKETCKFEVRSVVDKGLLEARLEIARICSDASENDTLLIYYSGSGYQDKDKGLFLIVADSDDKYLQATALDAEFILSQLRVSKCRHIILVIDGCHAGAFFNNNRGIPNGLYAITSCGAEEMCSDTPEGGAFSLALCAGLRDAAADRDGDGLVSIDELHLFVKQLLRKRGFQGTPQKWVWNVPEPIYMTAVPRHVFFSYAREDMNEADRMVKALQEEGLSIWIDRQGIRSGNWKERVTAGLNRARAVVVLLTKDAFSSDTVRKELAFAAKKNVPIIPVMPEEIPEKMVPDWFTLDYDELQRHVIGAEHYKEDIKELALAILSLRKPEPVEEQVMTR